VELGAGRGRSAAKLLPLAGRLHLVDLHPNNLEACRRRFGGDPRLSCHVTDGRSLPLPDAAATFLFSFDSVVHFDSDVVRAYLREAWRVLRPGGHAFLHHSNTVAHPGGDFRAEPHWRNFMSKELLAHYALKEGLEVVRQEPVDWAGDGGFIETSAATVSISDSARVTTAAAAGQVADNAVAQAATMTTEVATLTEASTSIGEVIRIISGIADQTNLLALNATIEAARAGELGRGFAVVASEVKDLARETAAATQQVSDQIAGIQASSEQVTAGIHATSEVIGRLDAVQTRITDVLEEQVRMARAIQTS